VRLSRLPLQGFHLRRLLDRTLLGWEERFDWTLLLERESFFVLSLSAVAFCILLVFRILLGWYADHRLKIPRFRFRSRVVQAGMSFFRAPEIK
jgi:hypothetical protein